jgi:hypothetical protein
LRPPGLVFCKVAGFVCESIQLNTNQVILEFFFTKQIQKTNLLNTVEQN